MSTFRLFIVLIVIGLISGFIPLVHGENWPHWRGPSATGVSSETGLPVRWSDTENIAWKSEFRGVGISTPIVWGDRVFVTSQAGTGGSRPGPRLVQGSDPTAAGERPLGNASS